MVAFLLIIYWLLRKVLGQLARLIARRPRTAQPRRVSGARGGDSSLHSRGAAADVEDIDDMLDAIAELRRRNGRREIGEELADELMRGTWDE
jgi:hypothetical protein